MKIRHLLCAALLLLGALDADAQRRKNKKDVEPRTQVLEALPDPPDAVVAETARLSFHVSPLSDKGLLSQQVRDAIKALRRDNRGAAILKLRAFVAGSGDLRRVAAIVSEEFTEDRQPLPAVSTVQVGALPMVGAQVVMESISSERRPVNQNGLAFISAGASPDAAGAVTELQKRSAGMEVVRLTCFLSSLDDLPDLRNAVSAAFPAAPVTYVQTQRQAVERQIGCETVGRLSLGRSVTATPDAVAITAPKIVLTATKLVFRDQEADVRLTFQRLGRSIEPLGATLKDTLWAGVFGLTRQMNAQISGMRAEFFDASRPVAGTTLIVEGLPSTDATAAIELIAAVR